MGQYVLFLHVKKTDDGVFLFGGDLEYVGEEICALRLGG